jgi:hypothetical protein
MAGRGERKEAEILTFGWEYCKRNQAGCEVLIVMTTKSIVFCDVRHEACHLGEACSVHLQNRRASQARNQEIRAFLAAVYCLHFQGPRVSEARNQTEQSCFLLGLLFAPDDGSSTFRRNVDALLLKYTALQARRHSSSSSTNCSWQRATTVTVYPYTESARAHWERWHDSHAPCCQEIIQAQDTVLATGRIMNIRRDNSVNEATDYGLENRGSVSRRILLFASTSRSILVSPQVSIHWV